MAHQYLAALANATGDWESAEKFYDQAIEDQPDFALSYKQRGYQRLRAEKWTEALADFDKVLEIQPDDSEALKYKAYVLQKLKRADQALELYNRAIGLNPMDAQAYFSKGNILYQKQAIPRRGCRLYLGAVLPTRPAAGQLPKGLGLPLFGKKGRGLPGFTKGRRRQD
jgi:tetratricopeptide (TPR) repeat protein